jgi:hypothetical protein
MSGSQGLDCNAKIMAPILSGGQKPPSSTNKQAIYALSKYRSATPRSKAQFDIWASILKMPWHWQKRLTFSRATGPPSFIDPKLGVLGDAYALLSRRPAKRQGWSFSKSLAFLQSGRNQRARQCRARNGMKVPSSVPISAFDKALVRAFIAISVDLCFSKSVARFVVSPGSLTIS